MNEENVLLFDPESRGGMARRGAPDKGGPPSEWIVLRCPSCGSDLRLDADWTEGHEEVLCARCETEIPLPDARRKIVR